MGIYSIKVYFLTCPTPQEVAAVLEMRTGLRVAAPLAGPAELQLTSSAHPAHPVILSWCIDWQQKHAQLKAALQMAYPLPVATHPGSITLEAAPINTRAHSYLRNVALAVLHQLGGVTDSPFTLPAWADHPWHKVPPRSFWQWLKSHYVSEF
jgi:hypothetical protein